MNIKRNSRKGKLAITATSLFGFLLLLTIFIAYIREYRGADIQECRPVWMYPSYARLVGFDQKYTKFASKYSLYLYREQGIDPIPEENNESNFLSGIPLLFIPGNAGSYKQVRSFASQLSTTYQDKYTKDESKSLNPNANYYDVFSADFNEDFTAFHGRTLLDQAEFVNEAVKFILALYEKKPNPPKSVLILGHSMGGIVARVVMTLPSYRDESINTILTLASPHSAPPLTFDQDLLSVYSSADKFWSHAFNGDKSLDDKNIAKKRLRNVSLVSITGGLADSILPADYTTLGYLVPPTNGFTVYSTGIPGVWTPIDHLALVWCGQLREQVSNMLLEIADNAAPSRTYNLEKRMKIMRKYLLSGFEKARLNDAMTELSDKSSITLKVIESKVQLDEILRLSNKDLNDTTSLNKRVFTFSMKEQASQNELEKLEFSLLSSSKLTDINMLREDLNSGSSPNHISVLGCNTMPEASLDDIYDLTDGTSMNAQYFNCKDLNEFSEIVPNVASGSEASESSYGGNKGPYEALRLDSNVLSRFDTLMVIQGKVNSDNSDLEEDDIFLAQLARLESTHFTLNDSLKSLILFGSKTSFFTNALASTINVRNIYGSILAFKLNVEVGGDRKEKLFSPFIRQWKVDPYEVKWHLNVDKISNIALNIHGITSFVPFKVENEEEQSLNLELWSRNDLKTPVTIRINIDYFSTLKLLVDRYRITLVSTCVSIVLISLIFQFHEYYKTSKFPSLIFGLARLTSPITFLFTSFVASILTPLSKIEVLQRIFDAFDPVVFMDANDINVRPDSSYRMNNYYLGLNDSELWIIGPLFLVLGVALVAATYFLTESLTKLLGKSIGLLIGKESYDKVPEFQGRASRKDSRPNQLKGAIVSILFVVLITLFIPYQFIYVVALIIQAIHLVQISSKGIKEALNFQLSIFLLMLWILPINVPLLIVFVHNLTVSWKTPFSSHHNALAILPIFLFTERKCFMDSFKNISRREYLVTQAFLGYFVFYAVIYGSRHTFILHHLLNIFFCWLSFVHWNN